MSVIAFISKRFTQLIVPALTSVDMPGYTMGYRGAKMLIAKLQDPSRDPEQVLLAPELIVRESSAPHRSRNN
jgi:LacI family transcriptional regulator